MALAAHLVIKKLRQEHPEKITQTDMASVLDISPGTYSRKEQGSIAITLTDAEKIADRLGLTLGDIFGNTPANQEGSNVVEDLKAEIAELSQIIVQLNKQLAQKDREILKLQQEVDKTPSGRR